MRITLRHLAASLAACTAVSAQAATWSSTAPYGAYTSGAYSFNNDVWGSGAGPQTIWVNSPADWGVNSNQPNTGGIKSYPHINFNVNKALGSLTRLTSTMSATTPAGGAWESAYDIWDTNHAYEIMLWMNYTGTAAGCGNVKPISYNWSAAGCAIPVYTNVAVGGHTWNVYRGSNGANQVFSLLRTSKTNNATVDVLAVLKYLQNQGWMGNINVGEVQFGFEITSSAGGMDFGSKGFSVTAY
jgi:xyloglucan-specific endo-beta-1,4-glucanase